MSEATSTHRQSPSRALLARAIGRLWWLILLRGVLLVILGLFALFSPDNTLEAFTRLLGIFAIFDGLVAIVSGLVGWDGSQTWMIARGTIALIIGLFVLVHAAIVGAIAAAIIVCIIGIHAIAVGVLEIMVAAQERKHMEGEGWLAFGGVLSIIFGALLLAAPLMSVLVLVRVIGFFVILFGAVLVSNALRARSLLSRIHE